MMKIISRPRAGGKTYELLEWVLQAQKTKSYPFWDRIILTTHLSEAQRLRTQLRTETDDPDAYNLVFSVNEWVTAHRGLKPVQIAFDNLDLYIQARFGTVSLATITEE
jgi:hypothetical protein